MAIITICRGTRSGGELLATCLAEALGYPVLGREVIHKAAAELGLPVPDMTVALARSPGLLERGGAERNTYVSALQAALAEHAVDGHLIYHGLAGQLLLRDVPAVCRVRLIAPLEMRLGFLKHREGLNGHDGEAFIRTQDRERARWVKLLYGERIEDPALYDMVINLEVLDIEMACALVTTLVRQPEYAVTERVRERLRDFLLACRVKTVLLRAPETAGLPLEVRVEDGRVEVSGSAPALAGGETGNRIAALTRTVEGVSDVRLKFEWFDPYP